MIETSESGKDEMPIQMLDLPTPFDIVASAAKWAGRGVLLLVVAIAAIWLAVVTGWIF